MPEQPPSVTFDSTTWDTLSWSQRYKYNGLQQWNIAYHSGLDDLVPKDQEGELVDQTEFDDSKAVYHEWPTINDEGAETIEKVVLNKDINENYWGNGAAYGGNAYHYNFPPDNPVEGDVWCRSPADIPVNLIDAVDGKEQIFYQGAWTPIISKPTIDIGVSQKPTTAAPIGSVAILDNGTTYVSIHSFIPRWIRGDHTHTIAGDFNDMGNITKIPIRTIRLNWDDKKFYKPRIFNGDARKIDWVEADINNYTRELVNNLYYPENWDDPDTVQIKNDIIKNNELNVCSHFFIDGTIRLIQSLDTIATCDIKITGSPNSVINTFFVGSIDFLGASISGVISTTLDSDGNSNVSIDEYQISSNLESAHDNWINPPEGTSIDVLFGTGINSAEIISIGEFSINGFGESSIQILADNNQATGDPTIPTNTNDSFSDGESLFLPAEKDFYIYQGELYTYVSGGVLKRYVPVVNIMGSELTDSGSVGRYMSTSPLSSSSIGSLVISPISSEAVKWDDENSLPFYGATTNTIKMFDFDYPAGYGIPAASPTIANRYAINPVCSYVSRSLIDTNYLWGVYYKYADLPILQDFEDFYRTSSWNSGETPEITDVTSTSQNLSTFQATYNGPTIPTRYDATSSILLIRKIDKSGRLDLPNYSSLVRELWVKVNFYGSYNSPNNRDNEWWDSDDLVTNARNVLASTGLGVSWTKYMEFDGLQDETVDFMDLGVAALETIQFNPIGEWDLGIYRLVFNFQFQIRWSIRDITLFDDIDPNSIV